MRNRFISSKSAEDKRFFLLQFSVLDRPIKIQCAYALAHGKANFKHKLSQWCESGNFSYTSYGKRHFVCGPILSETNYMGNPHFLFNNIQTFCLITSKFVLDLCVRLFRFSLLGLSL
uniref:Uncharacterized protein n=1 Tax=Cacopsylla melanoneura TaxID=428564 RepID=A0A8D8RZX5_9HEMI